MTAKRVSSAKELQAKAAAERRRLLALELLENLIWNCDHNPDDVKATTAETWRQIFQRIAEGIR